MTTLYLVLYMGATFAGLAPWTSTESACHEMAARLTMLGFADDAHVRRSFRCERLTITDPRTRSPSRRRLAQCPSC